MDSNYDLSMSLRRTLIALAACVFAVVICYYFVDRQTAFFVHRHPTFRVQEVRWLTEPPPLVQSWSPLLLAALAVRRVFGPWRTWQAALFLASVSLIVADQFRESVGHLCGRYWPETWHDNNPSLIGNGAYGFHPFEVGDDAGSFPSGHAARIVAFFSVLWLMLPRGRWVYIVAAGPLLVALVAMNYHFVGDVVAGSVLGGIIGIWATRLAGVEQPDAAATAP